MASGHELDQALPTKLVAGGVSGFGHAITADHHEVPGFQGGAVEFIRRAGQETEHGTASLEPVHAVAPQHERRLLPAIAVAQSSIPIHDAAGTIRGVVGIAYMGERDITEAELAGLREQAEALP